MPNLYGLLTEAQDGEVMARLGRQFGVTRYLFLAVP